MTQMGIIYKTDDEQFGKEKYLFPEETLYYPYADCEDRSFLYGWLVKNLVGIDYVGLLYPNHLATAINLQTKGANISHKNKNYIVADPTYMGAKIGMPMKHNPKVIYSSY